MIDFLKVDNKLVLRYTPEEGETDLIDKKLSNNEIIGLSWKCFHVRNEYRHQNTEVKDGVIEYHFTIGQLEENYYHITKEAIGIDFELFIHKSIQLTRKYFVAVRNIAIFPRIGQLGISTLHIGGEAPDALPNDIYKKLLKNFPNTTELNKYAQARISSIIRQYIQTDIDGEASYNKYLNKKPSHTGEQLGAYFAEYEKEKFDRLHTKMNDMLASTARYNETQWQKEILQIILFLYPKYIRAFREAPVVDSISHKTRKIDFLLVDASGYIDAIEIKKPFDGCLVTPKLYRDNHVPMRELSGTVMQIEKYLYHLNRWGVAGEQKLNETYSDSLPKGLSIKIVNPAGLIIMGRDCNLTPDQRNDFEVIRRKYRNVLDIMTYDDILRRLETIRNQLSSINIQ